MTPRNSSCVTPPDGDAAVAVTMRDVAARTEGRSSALLRAREIPDFTLGPERTDVRGWTVYSNDAVLVGYVASLFIDMNTTAVRYLGLTVSDNKSKMPAGEVLVPVGSAWRPDDRQVVVLKTLSYAQLASAPRVPRRPITQADEAAALCVYGMAISRDVSPNDLYCDPNFEEKRLFGART